MDRSKACISPITCCGCPTTRSCCRVWWCRPPVPLLPLDSPLSLLPLLSPPGKCRVWWGWWCCWWWWWCCGWLDLCDWWCDRLCDWCLGAGGPEDVLKKVFPAGETGLLCAAFDDLFSASSIIGTRCFLAFSALTPAEITGGKFSSCCERASAYMISS